MIASRDPLDLVPDACELALKLIAECKKEGIDLILTSTYRDFASQAALYAQGRTTPGNKVTNAKPGSSFHQYRVAFDVCPLVNGKPDWTTVSTWNRIGKVGKQLGLEWAGDWDGFKEQAHFQLPGLSLTKLKKEFPNGR